ncbi:hypothetical protein B0H13DRAFT_1987585 [Mycena leptocephala]|nr:hypothetical protein B0H13DRAFT_1987585 [Mycena leptocephala]
MTMSPHERCPLNLGHRRLHRANASPTLGCILRLPRPALSASLSQSTSMLLLLQLILPYSFVGATLRPRTVIDNGTTMPADIDAGTSSAYSFIRSLHHPFLHSSFLLVIVANSSSRLTPDQWQRSTSRLVEASPPLPTNDELEDERTQYVLIDDDIVPHAATQRKLRA